MPPSPTKTSLLRWANGRPFRCGWPSAVLFTSYRTGNADIFVMDLDGRNQVQLTNDPAIDYAAVWSPDGQWIAFTSNRTGNLEVFVLLRVGGTALNLTNHPGADHTPSWR